MHFLSCFAFALISSHLATVLFERKNSLGIAPQQLGEFENLEILSAKRDISLLNLLDGDAIPFHKAWDVQKGILQSHLHRLDDSSPLSGRQFMDNTRDSFGKDTIMLLQHEPVYTLGTGSDEVFIKDSESSVVPVVRMDRGGEVTYHGPGQLVAYPILDLRGYKQDIHWYIRALEEVVIRALARFGIKAVREDGLTGVWVDGSKVAAVGIKCRRWVTMHGFAINVDAVSLENFAGIVPCGLENRQVGYVNQFLDTEISLQDMAGAVLLSFEEVMRVQCVEQANRSK